MSSKALIGMYGVYLAEAELSRRGFIVSLTSRNMFGADLLVTDQRCRKAWSVQVKTTTKPREFKIVNRHAQEIASNRHIYVFVDLKDNVFVDLKDNTPPKFQVLPSKVVAAGTKLDGRFWVFPRPMITDRERERQWKKVFGDPGSPPDSNGDTTDPSRLVIAPRRRRL
jgi:hypothetical protein